MYKTTGFCISYVSICKRESAVIYDIFHISFLNYTPLSFEFFLRRQRIQLHTLLENSDRMI